MADGLTEENVHRTDDGRGRPSRGWPEGVLRMPYWQAVSRGSDVFAVRGCCYRRPYRGVNFGNTAISTVVPPTKSSTTRKRVMALARHASPAASNVPPSSRPREKTTSDSFFGSLSDFVGFLLLRQKNESDVVFSRAKCGDLHDGCAPRQRYVDIPMETAK